MVAERSDYLGTAPYVRNVGQIAVQSLQCCRLIIR